MADDLATKDDDPVARCYESMLVAYDTVSGGKTRPGAVSIFRQLPELIPPEERLIAFAQAKMTVPYRAKVVVAATTNRLLAFRDRDGEVMLDAPRTDARVQDYTEAPVWGLSLRLRVGSGRAEFSQLIPGPQSDRIFTLLGGSHPNPNRLDLLRDSQPLDPGYPPIAAIWYLAVYEDRLIDHTGCHLPFAGGEVVATCDTAGAIAVTRGRNLAAKGVGTVMLGPIGLFGMGNARHREVDLRELFLLVEGPGWAYTQQFTPEIGAALRQFAQTINVVARKCSQEADAQPAGEEAAGRELLAQVRELSALHDEGILTSEEFATQKARLLDRM